MKHFTNYAPLPLLLLCVLAGCSGQTLDGGSNTSGSSGASSSGASSSGASSSSGAVEVPIEGQIAGKPFAPRSVELQFSKAQDQWFLSLRNYGVDCGVIDKINEVPAEDKLVVTVGQVDAAPGTFALAYADDHGATFQVGVFEAGGPDPRSEPANEGTLRFDAWSEVPGSTVNGHLTLSNAESSIKGTFVAKVCPSR